MLQGEYTYIRSNRNEGVSSKTGKPFDIATITVSDGLESFEMDINPNLVPMLANHNKGDKIQVTVEVSQGYRGTSYQVTKVNALQTAK